MDISERLRTLRGHIRQEDFASIVGVKKNTVGRWERGEQVPDIKEADKILAAFSDISPTWLLSGVGEMQRGADLEISSHHINKSLKFRSAEELAQAKLPSNVSDEESGYSIDPIIAVINQELLRMDLDQKRAILKICMDITGEQYALVKHSSQHNRGKRFKGADVEEKEK